MAKTIVLGWDIGGVHLKAARSDGRSLLRPFVLEQELPRLSDELRQMAGALDLVAPSAHAVTMTGELSQRFRTKSEGVADLVRAVEEAFPDRPLHFFSVDGAFLDPDGARSQPLAVAAANWAASALLLARALPDAILIDVGSTTTDVIPIADGRVAAIGRTDPVRLALGELVYTGVLRTPVEAMAPDVPLLGSRVAPAGERFALAGDVHLWRGAVRPEEVTTPTADGRPATREFAGERLARAVCADRELLDEQAIDEIAAALAEAQLDTIRRAVERVRARHPSIELGVVAGSGAFLANAAAHAAGLRVVDAAESLGLGDSVAAPAAAVARLLADRLDDRS